LEERDRGEGCGQRQARLVDGTTALRDTGGARIGSTVAGVEEDGLVPVGAGRREGDTGTGRKPGGVDRAGKGFPLAGPRR
jgi:hypothetical protein